MNASTQIFFFQNQSFVILHVCGLNYTSPFLTIYLSKKKNPIYMSLSWRVAKTKPYATFPLMCQANEVEVLRTLSFT